MKIIIFGRCPLNVIALTWWPQEASQFIQLQEALLKHFCGYGGQLATWALKITQAYIFLAYPI